MSSTPSPTHVWKFFRTGGLDQVSLESSADLLALEQLDQELWVALGCPVKGLELDEKTLALVDQDGDGRIAVPEILAAVKWACTRLRDREVLLSDDPALPLAAISEESPEGRVLLASARQILTSLGRKDAISITVEEASNTAAVLAASPLNGDGIIPPEGTEDPAIQALIKDIIAAGGGASRASGVTGVTEASIGRFFAELAGYVAWTEKSATKEIAVAGDATDAACRAVQGVRAKVDDYFARIRLAAFDPRSVAALNRSEADYAPIAAAEMKGSAEELRNFPLARIEPGKPLPLFDGVNPAWAPALAALHEHAVVPLLGADQTSLTAAEWADINARLAPYETWIGSKTGAAVEKIGVARIKEIMEGAGRDALQTLVERDKALQPEFSAISNVERLARYKRDLRTLLHNFVNFADFYSRDRYAIFQAGTLYLDSRSTELCIRVNGVSPLAAASKIYTAYCTCTPAGGGAPMTIAACFTQGDSDFLFAGRNGIFYDRKGKLWHAVVTSIADHPISIRQAFWSPYKKFLRMIEEQVAKRAAAAESASNAKLAAAAEQTAAADQAKPAAQPKKFDLALVTGIGVALGAIGTFLATVFAKFVEMPAWQLPLVLVAIILVISLPSMFIAALKLRQRTLGPILEGNGWAINGRVKISIPFGAKLTRMATFPPGAKRSLDDPYEDRQVAQRKRRILMLLVVLLLAAAAWWVRWDHNCKGHYFWQSAPQAEAGVPPAN